MKHIFFDVTMSTDLKSWTREELIDWLCWNDHNGVYRDEDSIQEFGNTMSKSEAIELIKNQL